MSGLGGVLGLLAAAGPAEDSDRLMEFGQFVGSWELEVSYFDADGSETRTTAEWHWDWILGGRAVMDVLALAPRPDAPAVDSFHTLVRVLDSSTGQWKVVWFAPQHGIAFTLIGGPSKDGTIVLQAGPGEDEPARWVFSDITDSAFLWEGFTRDEPEGPWRLEQRMTARRSA